MIIHGSPYEQPDAISFTGLATGVAMPSLLSVNWQYPQAGLDPNKPAIEQACAAASDLIAIGVDPNKTNSRGETALGLLGSMCRGTRPDCARFAMLLMDHGANPMLNDKPLGNTINLMTSGHLATAVLGKMAKMERAGGGLRDENGGNALHYLARVDVKLAITLLEEDTMTEQSNEHYFPSSMFNEQRHDGNTPLHVLWGHYLAGRAFGPRQEDCWLMTQHIITMGGSVMVPDANEATVAELIETYTVCYNNDNQAYIGDQTGIWPYIKAQLDERRLLSNTPATLHGSNKPRL